MQTIKQKRGKQILVKLTKYFNDGIVINQNLVFEGKGKTTDDLLTELNNFGLDVPYLDTGGERAD